MARTNVDDDDDEVADVMDEGALSPLLADPVLMRSDYRRRRDPNDYIKVHPADVDSKLSDGWQLDRSLKTSVWLKKAKPKDRLLEDRVWCLFHRMGYPVLSGKHFKIRFQRRNNSNGEKQVDVFAKDDETALVVECKAKEVMGRRNLTQSLHEIENLKGEFAKSIRSYFGDGYNPKIIWMVVTENIIWNEKDLERAEAAQIRVVTDLAPLS